MSSSISVLGDAAILFQDKLRILKKKLIRFYSLSESQSKPHVESLFIQLRLSSACGTTTGRLLLAYLPSPRDSNVKLSSLQQVNTLHGLQLNVVSQTEAKLMPSWCVNRPGGV